MTRKAYEKFQCQWASSFWQKVEGAAKEAKNCLFCINYVHNQLIMNGKVTILFS